MVRAACPTLAFMVVVGAQQGWQDGKRQNPARVEKTSNCFLLGLSQPESLGGERRDETANTKIRF